MFSESVAGGYRVIDTQEKTTVAQSITALESAWNNLTGDEKLRSGLIINSIVLRSFRTNSFMFGAIAAPSNNATQIIIAKSGLYAASIVATTGAVSYNDYSSLTTLGAAQLIVFN